MRPAERVRSPFGIAFYGFGLVILLVWAAAVARLASEIWTVDDVPQLVDVLLPLGCALTAIGGVSYMALGVYWQLGSPLPRPQGGRLALEPPRWAALALVLGCAGVWIFVAGATVAFVDLRLDGKIDTVGLGVVALWFCGAIWIGYGLFRLSQIRFVADGWGVRWDSPFWPSSTQVPWERIARIELRGSRLLSRRMVVITNDGRSRLVWASDPSIPVSMVSAQTILDEVVRLRQ